MSWDQTFLLVLGLALIAGCAGYQATLIERPPVPEPCGIVVCEHWGPGRVDREKDCRCSGAQTIEDIFN